ncbi:MAG: pantetheine-phosphate adenylyltransferase [bacterium]|nr:pantetheine-phosphate adenylyltransferase [bacterium]
MSRKAVFCGSFDPPTIGHGWLLTEGARLFDELIVLVGTNPAKRHLFRAEDRCGFVEKMTARLPNVSVHTLEDRYLVQFAAVHGAGYLLRSMRSEADAPYEIGMRHINSMLDIGIQTVFLVPPAELSFISSTMVKTLFGPCGWEKHMRPFLPREAAECIIEKMRETLESRRDA